MSFYIETYYPVTRADMRAEVERKGHVILDGDVEKIVNLLRPSAKKGSFSDGRVRASIQYGGKWIDMDADGHAIDQSGTEYDFEVEKAYNLLCKYYSKGK